ncbi:hypothetical protein FGG08_001747 [Glutinoglossum americanum]|uniref:Uncharacterized protein n=1 Tax=Glutinoglossum americanum TaxID=1670608 RepID=A0A9P8L521_9PEZI|nr:hypothetical protein FGG08_001747 [Glutinoglossum americanum]
MSAYIAIPARSSKGGQKQQQEQQELGGRQTPGSSSSSSTASSYSSSPNTAPLSLQITSSPPMSANPTPQRYRRPSLLSSSISKQEHTVVDVGHPDGPPRLITCVKASQGFDWNQDIFLPSRHDRESSLEARKDPVHEILLTESEIASMFPQ